MSEKLASSTIVARDVIINPEIIITRTCSALHVCVCVCLKFSDETILNRDCYLLLSPMPFCSISNVDIS